MDQPPPQNDNQGPGGLTLVLVFVVVIVIGGYLVYKLAEYEKVQRCLEERHSNCLPPIEQPDQPGRLR